MSYTVKRLITALEAIENKYLEVEVGLLDKASLEPEIAQVSVTSKKVIIILERRK